MQVEVLIVGAGPVGTMLAGELRLAGITTMVVDRLERPSPHSRAFRMQSRSLELLDQRGLLDEFRAQGKPWSKAHFAGLQPLLELGALPSPYPFALAIPQTRTEAILEAHAVRRGAEIRRGRDLVALTEHDDALTAVLTGPDGSREEVTASFVVGCDGGGSTVRKLAGIPFPGTEPAVSALLGDVRLADPGQLPSGVPGTLRTPRGLLMAVSLEEGVTRILTTRFTGRPDPDEEVTLDHLRSVVREIVGAEVNFDSPRWLSRFTDTTRLAAHYRAGRVLLAGDAAHVHFPIGAQGLNLGLQDAVNLGWKLAATIRGTAAAGLLDTYEAERRPAAERVLRETRAQLALMNPDERISPLRELIGELLELPPVNLFLAGLLTGIDARTPRETDDHPLIGGRAAPLEIQRPDGRPVTVAELLRGGRGVLLDLADRADLRAVAAGWSAVVDLAPVRSAGKVDADAVLVRPDGHVAWAAPVGAEVSSLSEVLGRWFGSPHALERTPEE